MSERWAMNGHWVVKRFDLFGGKLAVLDADGKTVETIPLRGRKWTLVVGDREYLAVRHKTDPNRMNEVVQLFSASGILVPPGGKLLQPLAAPTGSVCRAHAKTGAVRACTRCGDFICEACLGADAVRCDKCFGAHLETHEHERSALVFGAAAGLFLYFGALGAVLGFLAGAIAVAVARREPRPKNMLLVSGVIYLIALAVVVLARIVLAERLSQ